MACRHLDAALSMSPCSVVSTKVISCKHTRPTAPDRPFTTYPGEAQDLWSPKQKPLLSWLSRCGLFGSCVWANEIPSLVCLYARGVWDAGGGHDYLDPECGVGNGEDHEVFSNIYLIHKWNSLNWECSRHFPISLNRYFVLFLVKIAFFKVFSLQLHSLIFVKQLGSPGI